MSVNTLTGAHMPMAASLILTVLLYPSITGAASTGEVKKKHGDIVWQLLRADQTACAAFEKTLPQKGTKVIAPLVQLLATDNCGGEFPCGCAVAIKTLVFLKARSELVDRLRKDRARYLTTGRNPYSRSEIIKVLGVLGDNDVIATLARDMEVGPPRDREEAAEALARIGTTSVPTLTRLLRSNSFEVRTEAVRTLGKMGSGSQEAVGFLAAAAADPQIPCTSLVGALWHLRWDIVEALRKIGTKRAIRTAEEVERWAQRTDRWAKPKCLSSDDTRRLNLMRELDTNQQNDR